MYRAALFDMDGLLIDSEAAIMRAWMWVAAAMEVPLSAHEYLSVVGLSAPDAFARLSGIFGGQQPFELARRRVLARLERTPAAGRFPLKAGAGELLASFAQHGIPCAVASSSDRKDIEARLSAVGVRSFFDAIVGGDEVTHGKPDPSIYLEAARRLGVEPGCCLAFEDSHNGAKAVLASGSRLILVPDLLAPTEDLSKRAFCVLASLSSAVPHVGSWLQASRDG